MFKKSPFWIRLMHWEFWSMDITYLPVIGYFILLSIRMRSFGFWSAVNPAIQYAGMRGETKYDILSLLPQQYYPPTFFVPQGTSWAALLDLFQKSKMDFPLVGKPDIGERGMAVKKIKNIEQLSHYHKNMNHVDYMIQGYIPYDEEYAIFHYRYPNEEKGRLISVCKKSFLQVVGDGKKTIYDLIMEYPRAILQLERLEKKLGDNIYNIPAKNEIIRLGYIGNHSLGTEFLNHNHEIDEALTSVFDTIEQNLEGVYMARYDLRCKSMEDMKQGKEIYIVEINGVGAEAAHIYDQNMTLRERYQAMFEVWTIMFKIAKINKKRGHSYMSLKDIWAWRKMMKNYYPKLKGLDFGF